ncbi:HAD family hydrolase [Paracoccus aerodenitrificans]|uniref:HAD family hydrolase n=1 Tax=Paracoccus aerodenitrificans TaxID=3017781 RepID=UPI0022F0BDA0|nr:HAD family phosphatase [Paracoccus aerodenitrificans]WBU64381.1 HAD family phosphatase [Paracoccus aerodenitrificans]
MKAIVFDIGNVLVDWDPIPAFLPDLGSEDAVHDFMARVDFSGRNLRADAGVPFAELAAELSDPQDAALLAAYPSRFATTITQAIEGTWDLMERLRGKGLEIHAITNWSAETWPEGVKAHPRLAEAFQTIVVSGMVGMVKPDPAIYEYFCKQAGLAAADCLFIDDKPENCAAAEAVGMQAEIFTSPEKLEAALTARGLL